MLLHGTKRDHLPGILAEGFRLDPVTVGGSSGAAFGDGIYLCDNPGKADQYTVSRMQPTTRPSHCTGSSIAVPTTTPATCSTLLSAASRLVTRRSRVRASMWRPPSSRLRSRRARRSSPGSSTRACRASGRTAASPFIESMPRGKLFGAAPAAMGHEPTQVLGAPRRATLPAMRPPRHQCRPILRLRQSAASNPPILRPPSSPHRRRRPVSPPMPTGRRRRKASARCPSATTPYLRCAAGLSDGIASLSSSTRTWPPPT